MDQICCPVFAPDNSKRNQKTICSIIHHLHDDDKSWQELASRPFKGVNSDAPYPYLPVQVRACG